MQHKITRIEPRADFKQEDIRPTVGKDNVFTAATAAANDAENPIDFQNKIRYRDDSLTSDAIVNLRLQIGFWEWLLSIVIIVVGLAMPIGVVYSLSLRGWNLAMFIELTVVMLWPRLHCWFLQKITNAIFINGYQLHLLNNWKDLTIHTAIWLIILTFPIGLGLYAWTSFQAVFIAPLYLILAGMLFAVALVWALRDMLTWHVEHIKIVKNNSQSGAGHD